MSSAEGKKLILSPEAETKLKETLRFEGKKILSDLIFLSDLS